MSKHTSAVVLKFQGKPFSPERKNPNIEKVVKFLETSPVGELFDAVGVSDKVGLHRNFVKDHISEFPPELSAKVMGKRYYGSAATIAELKKQVGL